MYYRHSGLAPTIKRTRISAKMDTLCCLMMFIKPHLALGVKFFLRRYFRKRYVSL